MKDDDEGDSDSTLPGLGRAAKEIAKSGVFNDLFGPAAKVYGTYLQERAIEQVEGWKKKNIENHKQQVEDIVGPPKKRPPSERQFLLVMDWIEGAEDVSAEEPEIAALWQSLLADIYSNDFEAKEKIAAIKGLDGKDAKFILTVSLDEISSDDGSANLDKLVALGILAKYSPLSGRNRSRIIFLATTTVLAILMSFAFPSLVGFVLRDSRTTESMELVKALFPLFMLMCVFVVAMPYINRLGTYEFTKLGRSIRSSAVRFYNEDRRSTNPAEQKD